MSETTVGQILSHGAGLVRDGDDAGHWLDRRPFPDRKNLRSTLMKAPTIEASTRFKYSNHGYGLLGLVIEHVTGEPYCDWIRREIVAAAKLEETEPDGPVPKNVPMAIGHSGKWPLGHRVLIPSNQKTRALAPATGFVSTAGDLARFFASLDLAAKQSVLSPASRREMVRKQWRVPDPSMEFHYGLGVVMGQTGDWDWVSHSGGIQGCITRTIRLPGRDLSISVLTNSTDGLATYWSNGMVHILKEFEARGAPTARTRDWSGRWWNLWGAVDLIAMRDHVVVASPGFFNPFSGTSEIDVTSRDHGTIRAAAGNEYFGESARLVRGRNGNVREIWLGGMRFVSERQTKAELKRRYGG